MRLLAAAIRNRHGGRRESATYSSESVWFLSRSNNFSISPKWIPPGQMFWAVTTTKAFALAAIALLSDHSALLASRLLTIMVIGSHCWCGCRRRLRTRIN